MPHANDAALRSRVLILAPVGRDAVLTKTLLRRADIDTQICASLGEFQTCLTQGAGAALLTEEALAGQDLRELIGWIAQQPSWSDFPFILLLEPGVSAESGGQERDVLQQSGNLTLLERPVGTATLVSAVRAALRARGRQFQVHDALEAMTISERRYRTLAEALPQLVWTSQTDGQRDYFSRQWVEYTGIPEEQQLGLAWLEKVVHPEDRERIREHWMAAAQTTGDYDAELRIRRADGQYRWFKARATPVRDGNRVVKWFGTCTDITDIVEARESLSRGREELERLVEQRTRSLSVANDRLTAEMAEHQRTEEALRQSQKLEAISANLWGRARFQQPVDWRRW
jgi:PAS domain S-box-containing protein